MHPETLLDDRWPALLAGLPASFDLAATARSYRAFLRPREIRCAADLLRLGLAYGLGKLSLRSTALWAGSTALATMSDVAVLGRLRNAAEWFGALVQAMLAERVALPTPLWHGHRLRLVDATTLSQPGSAGTDWRLHVAYDLAGGGMTAVTLTDGHGGESLGRVAWRAGDIGIGDRGYAKAGDLRRAREAGADLIVRIGWKALPLSTAAGEPFDLFAALRRLPAEDAVGHEVIVRTGSAGLPVRLIAKRKTADAAERSREQRRRRSVRKGTTPDPRSLEAAGYLFVITTLPADRFLPEAVLSLYRLRWQIELAFKRLKSLLRIDALTAKDPKLVKAWISCNLIAALLVETLARHVRDSFPCGPRSRSRLVAE